MIKQNVKASFLKIFLIVCQGNGILFSDKKKQPIRPREDTQGTLNAYYRVKEANLKMLQRLAMWHFGKHKTTKIVKRSEAAKGYRGGGGWIGEAPKIFRAVKLFSTVVCWWIHVLIHLSQPTECTPKANPHVTWTLQLILMYEYRLSSGNKCTPTDAKWTGETEWLIWGLSVLT